MKGKGGGGVFEGEESLGDDGKSAIGFVGGNSAVGDGEAEEEGGRRLRLDLDCGWVGLVGLGLGRVGSVSVVSGGWLETKKCT